MGCMKSTPWRVRKEQKYVFIAENTIYLIKLKRIAVSALKLNKVFKKFHTLLLLIYFP